MATLRDAMRLALEAVGEQLPEGDRADRVILTRNGNNRIPAAVTVTYGPSSRPPKRRGGRKRGKSKGPDSQAVAGHPSKPSPAAPGKPNHSLPAAENACKEPKPGAPSVAPGPASTSPPPQADVEIMTSPSPRCLVALANADSRKPRALEDNLGCAEQLQRSRPSSDAQEVTIGLDFGTSCIKVVIGDASLERAFAVPFFPGSGVDAHLLPSRLFEQDLGGDDSSFSLHEGTRVHRDLKLGFLAYPQSRTHRMRLAAVLALVVRQARGWLYKTHRAIYKGVRIVWRVAIGFPSASALESEITEAYKELVHVAWTVAGEPGPVRSSQILALLDRVDAGEAVSSDLEVDVVPEIAAQIYGFVVSHSFDKNAVNRYLIVDVGAGTIDSSLFHLKPARGGRWDFEFYTAVVQPNGAANLHRHRVDWWREVLSACPQAQSALAELEKTRLVTDMTAPLPDTYEDYFDGIEARLGPKAESPDGNFFKKKVVAQVRGQTMWRAWRDGYLQQRDLTDVPMFLCGGGARMPFYIQLDTELVKTPGVTWLSAEPWVLALPGDLECDGVEAQDYDRLSVAYGLSKLNVGKIARAVPAPLIDTGPQESWRDRYIDKDQC